MDRLVPRITREGGGCPSINVQVIHYNDFVSLNTIIPRIAVASIIATWITGLVMVYVYEKVRTLTGDRMMWARALSANIVAMTVNSVLFVLMAFAGVLSTAVLINMVLIQVLFKFIDSFFELGFLYGLRELKDRGILNVGSQDPAAIVPVNQEAR